MNDSIDPYADIHHDHDLVPESCGCVSKWMPGMKDKLGTVYRCPEHQKQRDETISNGDTKGVSTFSSAGSLLGLIHQALRSAVNKAEPLDPYTEQTRTEHFNTGTEEGK